MVGAGKGDKEATRTRHCVRQVGSSCEQVQGQLRLQVRRWLGLGLKQVMEREMKQEQEKLQE